MKKDQKSYLLWGGVAVVVIVGLIFIMKKGGEPETTSTVVEKTDTTAKEKPPVVAPKTTKAAAPSVPPAVVTTKKPTGNVVELTAQGFVPATLEIKRGESVEFLNSSDMAMVIHTKDDKPGNAYPGFSQESGPLGRGGKFFFAFTTPGAWPYYNLTSNINNAKYQGVIVVK